MQLVRSDLYDTEVCTESPGNQRTVNGKYFVSLGFGMTICVLQWQFSIESWPWHGHVNVFLTTR